MSFVSAECFDRVLDDDSTPPMKTHSKTVADQIHVSIDEHGFPELPTIRMGDGYKTKAVQSMLRDYCTAHIREPHFNICSNIINVCELGFVTGNMTQVIPWGALVKDPFSWISKECVPDGFEWKDPSKIQVGEVFRLLYHWQARSDQDLVPLIWEPTCRLLQDADEPERVDRRVRSTQVQKPGESDQEEFDLSSGDTSDPPDESEHESDDHESNPGSSSSEEEYENLNLGALFVESRPDQFTSGMNCHYVRQYRIC